MKKKYQIIIILMFLILLLPISSSIFIDENKNESKDDFETNSFDNNEEIITYIKAIIPSDSVIYDNKIIKQVEMWDNESQNDYITINGIKKPQYPFDKILFNTNPKHIIAKKFIGQIFESFQNNVWVNGFAIGNIDWE